jgi:hypothetical protein
MMLSLLFWKKQGESNFPELWRNVCSRMNKQLEFRGFAMLEVQVKELIEDGILYKENGRIERR